MLLPRQGSCSAHWGGHQSQGVFVGSLASWYHHLWRWCITNQSFRGFRGQCLCLILIWNQCKGISEMATSCRNIYLIWHLFHPFFSKVYVSCSLGGIFVQVCPMRRDRAASIKGMVKKVSLKTTRYCGKIQPVHGLKTRATLPAWKGECPKYMPIPLWGSHFGGLGLPALCTRKSRTYTGQNMCKKTWQGLFWMEHHVE